MDCMRIWMSKASLGRAVPMARAKTRTRSYRLGHRGSSMYRLMRATLLDFSLGVSDWA
jgi:hypothetical protein